MTNFFITMGILIFALNIICIIIIVLALWLYPTKTSVDFMEVMGKIMGYGTGLGLGIIIIKLITHWVWLLF